MLSMLSPCSISYPQIYLFINNNLSVSVTLFTGCVKSKIDQVNNEAVILCAILNLSWSI